VTVIAPTAMAADGLSTAAMVLGPERGPRFLEAQGVSGLFITPDGAQTSVNL
jgi:thiamine biosynthesis lipoprotein ApbE